MGKDGREGWAVKVRLWLCSVRAEHRMAFSLSGLGVRYSVGRSGSGIERYIVECTADSRMNEYGDSCWKFGYLVGCMCYSPSHGVEV